MKNLISFTLAVMFLVLTVSCSTGTDDVPASPLSSPKSEDLDQTPIISTSTTPLMSSCSPTTSDGTIAPAVTIHSITFIIDDEELVLSAGDDLPASPGSEVMVKEVEICVGSFEASGGEACVDFVPTRKSGEEVRSEHAGTHMVPLTPGLTTLPGLDRIWIINQNWVGITAVVNHWPGVKTEDLDCAQGQCERDHRLILFFR